MATPNYSYEKRQRELAKKRKKEEKALRKTQPKPGEGSAPGDNEAPNDDATAGQPPADPNAPR